METQNKSVISTFNQQTPFSYGQVARNIDDYSLEKQKTIRKLKHISRVREKGYTNKTTTYNSKYVKIGHWSAQQNKKYLIFLKAHKPQFQQKHLRRTERIFKFMSNYLLTRTASQCRSHHQKMQKKCHTFQKIIHHLFEICQCNSSLQMNLQCNERANFWEEQDTPVNDHDKQNFPLQSSNFDSIEDKVFHEMPKFLEPAYDPVNKSKKFDRVRLHI